MSPEYSFAIKMVAENGQKARRLQELIGLISGVTQISPLTETPSQEGATTKIEWLTQKQAAEYLRVHPKTLHRYVKSGKLQSHQLGGIGRPRFKRDELDALYQPK